MSLMAALLLSGTDPAARFFAELAASNSATATLQRRCATPIVAEVDRAALKPATEEIRKALAADATTPIAYRAVKLKCGDVVLSHAENWYRPDRLTDAMNAQLLGDTPFGAVIASLHPTRRTIDIVRVDGNDIVVRHRALVISGDGIPLAQVIENYTTAVLAETVRP